MIVRLNAIMHASVCLVMHITKIFIIFTLACVCEERMGLQGFISLFVLFLSSFQVSLEALNKIGFNSWWRLTNAHKSSKTSLKRSFALC